MIEVKGVMIDKKWKWVAKNEDNKVYIFERKPKMSEQDWYAICAFRLVIYPTELNDIPWDQSLHEIHYTDDGIILIQHRPNFTIGGLTPTPEELNHNANHK